MLSSSEVAALGETTAVGPAEKTANKFLLFHSAINSEEKTSRVNATPHELVREAASRIQAPAVSVYFPASFRGFAPVTSPLSWVARIIALIVNAVDRRDLLVE